MSVTEATRRPQSTRTLPTTVDVLVDGGGPTGLALAAALAQLDVDVLALSAASEPSHESRAAGVQPRTVEDLARIGAADALLERGLQGQGFRVTTQEQSLLELSFAGLDTPYPYVLLVPQSTTEAVLEENVADRGATFLREHRIIAIAPEFDAVSVQVADPDGVVHHLRARYLVGADGLHSGARSAVDIPFDGTSSLQDYALADVHLARPLDALNVTFSFAPEGMLVTSPLPDDQLRVVASVQRSAGSYDLDAIRRLVDERVLADGAPEIDAVVQSSGYRVQSRLAASFRAGRVLLAGDAAHTHSPAGGQGMNTGIQDAINLAWKLAAVLNGADESLLDSYDAERRPNAQALLAFTGQLTAAATLDDPTLMGVRDRMLIAAAQDPVVPTLLANRLAQLEIAYPGDGADPLVGARVAPAGEWGARLGWTLLVPEGQSAGSMPGAVMVAPLPSGAPGADQGRTLLVRPDGYIAASAASPAALTLPPIIR